MLQDESHQVILVAIDVRTKRSWRIADMGPQTSAHGFSLAPDGNGFLTTLKRYQGDIAILDGLELAVGPQKKMRRISA